jgi:hypothetical protein
VILSERYGSQRLGTLAGRSTGDADIGSDFGFTGNDRSVIPACFRDL